MWINYVLQEPGALDTFITSVDTLALPQKGEVIDFDIRSLRGHFEETTIVYDIRREITAEGADKKETFTCIVVKK